MRSKTPKRISYCVAVLELVVRDPLYLELLQAVEKSHSVGIKKLQTRLFQKYGRKVYIHVPDPPSKSGIQFRLIDDEQEDALLWTSNCYLFTAGAHSPHGKHVWQPDFPSPLALGDPSLFIKVSLSRITNWDLDRLAQHFKALIRQCLPSSKLGSRGPDPKELSFLRTIRSDIYYRDLRRYDLHIKHGLSFRLIALLEKLGKTSVQPCRVGFPVSKESSVAESIPRIYKAIHRIDYKAKRRKLDMLGDITRYRCPSHNNNCDWSCPHLKTWLEHFNTTSPSPFSGSLSSLPLESVCSSKIEKGHRSDLDEEPS